jgi:hypothetical protein
MLSASRSLGLGGDLAIQSLNDTLQVLDHGSDALGLAR